MQESRSPRASRLTTAVWRGVRRDVLIRVAAAVLGLYVAVVVLRVVMDPATAAMPRPVSQGVTVFFLALALAALRRTTRMVVAAEEVVFWRDLQRGALCWLAVPILNMVFAGAYYSLWLGWTRDALYGLFYVQLYLGLAIRPHRQDRWRSVGLERALTWPTVALAIIGLFLYFLVPFLAGDESYDRGVAASSLFLVLDVYFTARLLHLHRSTRRPTWRGVYLFLALTPGLVFVNDLLGALARDPEHAWMWTVADVGWKLPPLFLLVASRARHFELPADPPATRVRIGEAFPGPLGQTMIFAMIFPLVHFGGDALGLLDPAIAAYRGSLIFVWLLMFGAVSFIQYGRLARSTARLVEERGRTERALRRIEEELRLNRQLQQKAAEQRASDEIFARAFQASPDVMAICRLDDQTILEINDSADDVLGYASHEITGRTLPELGFWVRADDEAEILAALRDSGSVDGREIVFRRPTGELRLGLFSARRIEIEDEPCSLTILADVTDQARRHERFCHRRDLLDGAAGAIAAVDARGDVVYWNAGAERLFGLSGDEVIGRDVTGLEACGDFLDELLARDGQWFDAELDAPEGCPSRVSGRAVPVGERTLILASEKSVREELPA